MSAQWDALVAAEPRLGELESVVRDVADNLIKPGGEIGIDQLWHHGGMKARMSALVGWHATRQELRNEAAYLTAYQHLFGLLEDRAAESSSSG